MTPRMELSSRLRNGQVVVTLSGELDVADAALVATALKAVATGRHHIVVDLTDLAFIDSSGLAALVRARQYARETGFDVLLAAPQQQVRQMLVITHLAEVFSVHACVEDATRNAALAPVT